MSILFVDIETAQVYPEFKDLPEDGKAAFKKKFGYRVDNGEKPDLDTIYREEAALYAEYSRVVCIGVGTVITDPTDPKKERQMLFLKSLAGTETEIFDKFFEILEKVNPTSICAHRGNSFDFPFINRRLLINNYPIPGILITWNKKPWEMNWIDTAEMWQFNDKKHYVSLITLCYVFGIESPKQDLDGSQVPAAFHRGEILRIASYCLEDVQALINVYRMMKGHSPVTIVKKAFA